MNTGYDARCCCDIILAVAMLWDWMRDLTFVGSSKGMRPIARRMQLHMTPRVRRYGPASTTQAGPRYKGTQCASESRRASTELVATKAQWTLCRANNEV